MMTDVTQHFNWIDYAILAVVGVSALISFFRGFVREAISMIAWVAGLFVALKFSITAQTYLSSWISSESIRYFICFVSIFLIIVIVGLVINLIVGLLMKSTGLSIADRFVGIFFGTVRGMAIVAVMLLMLSNMGSIRDSAALSQSTLAVKFKPAILWLNGFLPNRMKAMTQWVKSDLRIHKNNNVR